MTPPDLSLRAIAVEEAANAGLRLHPDFWVGGFFAAVGGLVWQQGSTLRQGTAASMGPGFVPLWLGVGLVLVGTLIALRSLRQQATRDGGDGLAAGYQALQPIAVTTAGLLAFSISLDSWGLFIASTLLVALARFDSWVRRPIEIAALAFLLAAISIAIFRYGLSVPVPIWPA
jgi:Tripartite tricarboxylate transporter TctB family